MKLSEESFVGLKRHFLGVLSEPSPLWVVPAPGPRVLLAGAALRWNGESVVDLGTAESPGEERQTLRVVNLGTETLTLKLENPNPWLEARWFQGHGHVLHLDGSSAELELVVDHDFLEDTVLAGSVRLLAESLDGKSRAAEIPVRFATHRTQPYGQFGFQGLPEPRVFDFGSLDVKSSGQDMLPAYTLSIQNLTSVPLVVSFADLPAWLVFEVDGYQRRGPVSGRFFERTAPFQVEIRPICSLQFLGTQRSSLRLRTNDARPAWRDVNLEFTARIETTKPYVTLTAPQRARLAPGEAGWVEAVLTNWGHSPARLSLRSLSPALQLHDRPVVPGARDGKPGQATLRIRIAPSQLPPGPHSLLLTLRIENGEPQDIAIPVGVDVVAASEKPETPRFRLRPKIVAAAAISLLLVLILILIFSSGAFSG